MRMRLLAAGTRMPAWVDSGFEDYAGRLRGDYRLELIEVVGAAEVRPAEGGQGETSPDHTSRHFAPHL